MILELTLIFTLMAIQFQNTVKSSVICSGIGLHSGKQISIKIIPAPADLGIVFKRTDVKEAEAIVPANFRNVVKTMLGTTIANKSGVEVATIEHLMAGLWGAGVDNAIIEIDGIEIPIMDGSSAPFIKLIQSVGLQRQDKPRKVIRIKDEIKFGDANRYAVLRPSKSFKVKFEIDFKDKAIGSQHAKFKLDEGSFQQEIANARTFGFKEEVEAMHKAGLGRGGSLENAIVVDNGKILNPEGLRFENEFVRHKVLDSVGDLYTVGAHIIGEFVGVRSGHHTNNEILKALIETPTAWDFVSPDDYAKFEADFTMPKGIDFSAAHNPSAS